MLPNTGAAMVDHDCCRKFVGFTPQPPQVLSGHGKINRLAEPFAVADKDLVSADHQRVGFAPADAIGLHISQQQCRLMASRILSLRATLDLLLIDIGRTDGEAQPGIFQHGATRGRLAGQD